MIDEKKTQKKEKEKRISDKNADNIIQTLKAK